MTMKPAVAQLFRTRMPEVLLSIKNHAEANRSDPFAGPRAACHYRNGLAALDDYHSERTISMEIIPDSDPEIVRHIVVHTNQKRP